MAETKRKARSNLRHSVDTDLRYADVIDKMTLEEKASLLSGGGLFRSKGIARLGIPAMDLADGPHGVRKQAGSTDHLGLNASLPATCYPTASAIANSWDEELAEELGRYLGTEAASQGVNMLLGPGLNIKRSPLCGRNFEYFSEDPYLSGKFAAALVRGIQSKGVSACPKHFAVNSQETLRMHSDSVIDERTLREIYLTAFEIAVTESNPLGLMTAYNKVNGVYASEHSHLLNDILTEEWGFKGIVVTDWGGSNDRVEAARAGGHLEMPTTKGDSDREVVAAVRAGKLDEARVDRLVDDYLNVVFATRLPENPQPFDIAKHHAFARKAASASIVLLKNEHDLLPIKTNASVAVIGDFAENPRYQGFGSSVVNPTKIENALEFLQAEDLTVTYSKGYERFGQPNDELLAEAVLKAREADIVLMFIGLDEMSEMEACDRTHMRVNQNQVDVLEAVAKVNQNVVAVFCGGAPFEVPWIDKCKAVIHGYLGGQAGTSALVEAITGKVNPSGKLAETWPLAYSDTAAYKYYPGMEKTTEYRESIFVGYRYFDTANIDVRFPFGFGLSYTSFAYSNLKIDGCSVSFNIKNTGKFEGAEVAQIYVGLDQGKVFRAKRELKGFAKVSLKPGEEKTISVELDDKAFRYFNVETGKYEIESGRYTIQVGASSRDIRLEDTMMVEGTDAPTPYDAKLIPSYYSGQVSDVADEEFERLLGRPLPPQKWDRSLPLDMNDKFAQLSYARWPGGRLVYKILTYLKNKAERRGQPDLNILFIYNSPFRSMAKNMGGALSWEMAEAVLFIFNGHFFRGLWRVVRAFFRKRKAEKDTLKKLENAGSEVSW
jgi:beta-glucosidase